ncbi:unnamed protein product [Durusdinium trenchii]|uniref:Mitochondrial n=2 Tax=Durusdinium trenchii TaxID=1381693 RepID=A0ABP0HJT8_9DINO
MAVPSPGGSRMSRRLQDTLMRYGQVGLVVHFCLSSISLVSCYLAVRHGEHVEQLLELVGKGHEEPSEHSQVVGAGSSMVMAFVLHKALMPLRVPVTVAVTPLAAAIWTRVAARWL